MCVLVTGERERECMRVFVCVCVCERERELMLEFAEKDVKARERRNARICGWVNCMICTYTLIASFLTPQCNFPFTFHQSPCLLLYICNATFVRVSVYNILIVFHSYSVSKLISKYFLLLKCIAVV